MKRQFNRILGTIKPSWVPSDKWKALTIYKYSGKLSWRLPAYPMEEFGHEQFMKVKRANRYLWYLERTIMQEVERDPARAWRIFQKAMNRSRALQAYAITKVEKGWYHSEDMIRMLKWVSKGISRIRKMEHILELKRKYIPKSNGKWRPLGVPSKDTRLQLTLITLFLQKYLETRIGGYQHGFREGRSCYTALMEVYKGWKEGKAIYEFDLKSFFNTVSYKEVCSRIDEEIPKLGSWIANSTEFSHPKMREEQPEVEMRRIGESLDGNPMYLKRGFSQGANWSPILATYALELAGFSQIEGLVMYADDGVIMRDRREELNLEEHLKYGVEIAKEKRNGWVINELKFLGVTFNKWTSTITDTHGRTISSNAPIEKIEEFMKQVRYEDKNPSEAIKQENKNWVWKPNKGSLLVNYWDKWLDPNKSIRVEGIAMKPIPNAWIEKLNIKIEALERGEIVYDVARSSTFATSMLLDILGAMSERRKPYLTTKRYIGNEQALDPDWNWYASDGVVICTRQEQYISPWFERIMRWTYNGLIAENLMNVTKVRHYEDRWGRDLGLAKQEERIRSQIKMEKYEGLWLYELDKMLFKWIDWIIEKFSSR